MCILKDPKGFTEEKKTVPCNCNETGLKVIGLPCTTCEPKGNHEATHRMFWELHSLNLGILTWFSCSECAVSMKHDGITSEKL